MTWLDRLIQDWRIRKARRYISARARVLDIGCADGALFRNLKFLREGVGIDPDLKDNPGLHNAELVRGFFPADLHDRRLFDVITLLAVLEHLPADAQISMAGNCFQYLKPGGVLIITVPSPVVDRILDLLKLFRLVHGMQTEQHYGFDVKLTPGLFKSAGFELSHARQFQLGLNNLFVFAKPESAQ